MEGVDRHQRNNIVRMEGVDRQRRNKKIAKTKDEGNETKKKMTMAEDEDDACSFHGTDFDAIHMHHMREDSDSDNTEDDPHVTLFNQRIFGPDNEAPVDEEEEEETLQPPKKKKSIF